MIQHLQELYRNRYLLYTFTERDIVARYKQTTIGILWAVIQPLFLMLIFTIIFSRFLGVSSGDIPYPIFSYVALLPWMFFSRAVTTASMSLFDYKTLITKIYFPREIAPLSMVVSSLVDFVLGFLVFVLMLVYYQIPVTWYILFVFLFLPLQIILVSGVSLFLSSLTVLVQDLKFALPLLLQVLMYGSPVIYSVTKIQSQLKSFFYFNPLVGIIEGYRQVILFGKPPLWDYLAISCFFSIGFCLFGYWFFKKVEVYFVDIL